MVNHIFKRIFFAPVIALICLSLLCGCDLSEHLSFTPPSDPDGHADSAAPNKPDNASGELRGVWISYLELDFQGKTQKEFENYVDIMYNNIVKLNLNAVFVQVRAHCDSVYPSRLFPLSESFKLAAEEDYDPLKYMINAAHQRNLKFHAWINPYRVTSDNDDVNKLPADSPVISHLDGDGAAADDFFIKFDGGIYLNPASVSARALIINGIRELVGGYDVDGIHFDDYFYPTSDTAFDAASYAAYCEKGGALPLDDWRRENVNALISGVYRAVKAQNSNVVFGISPGANIEKNYSSNYADIALWAGSAGFVDYICPQIYFGFMHPTAAFEETAARWENMERCDTVALYCGLAAYKIGREDGNISDDYPAAKNEWINNSDILARQAAYIKASDLFSGYILYSYSGITSANAEAEADNLLKQQDK